MPSFRNAPIRTGGSPQEPPGCRAEDVRRHVKSVIAKLIRSKEAAARSLSS